MLQFNKVYLHNFASYQHAEVDLQSKGFCLVSGRNNYKKDNSLSNGCGKSFIWNAVCFTLTGETINGVHSKLVNTNPSDEESYTKLDFTVDGKNYVITRYLAPKSDMQIICDGKDESGKGIRESEKKLGELLPDLNRELISSVIILGQGMPNKFSSFSPSGRKDMLEHLTKSDFMIEKVKNRVAARHDELNKTEREYADSQLVINTNIKLNEQNIVNYEKSLEKLKSEISAHNYDAELAAEENKLAQLTNESNTETGQLAIDQTALTMANGELMQQVDLKVADITKENTEYTEHISAGNNLRADYVANKKALEADVKKSKASNGICPTCGQKLPGYTRPDTTKQEAEIAELAAKIADVDTKIKSCNEIHQQSITEINNKYDNLLNEKRTIVTDLNKKLTTRQQHITALSNEILTAKDTIRKLAFARDNNADKLKSINESIDATNAELARLHGSLNAVVNANAALQEHIAVIKKMETMLKRDFRGYLLSNIIKYLNTKAKDFSEIVYGTRDLDITLDGNALDITYCNKIFDNLSGGEKQRVDLILQFALRNLLKEYLNINSNILVLDEITDFLDKKSCAAVMDLVAHELNSVESVFIVSHHDDELNLPIDSTLNIVKNEDGISEVC